MRPKDEKIKNHVERIFKLIFKYDDALSKNLEVRYSFNEKYVRAILTTNYDFLEIDFEKVEEYINNVYGELIKVEFTNGFIRNISVNIMRNLYQEAANFKKFLFHNTIDMDDEAFELWFKLRF
jgi:hypothetical protein